MNNLVSVKQHFTLLSSFALKRRNNILTIDIILYGYNKGMDNVHNQISDNSLPIYERSMDELRKKS